MTDAGRYTGIRLANEDDAGEVARIYNDAITDGGYSTADVEPVSVESRAEWIRRHLHPFNVYVLERPDAGTIGFCSLNPLPPRPAYRLVAETSVYVDHAHRRGLAAPAMTGFLIEEAQRLGFKGLMAVVYRKNRASSLGAMSVGFREVAALPEPTWFRGQWEEVVFLYKDLVREPGLPRPTSAALGHMRGDAGD